MNGKLRITVTGKHEEKNGDALQGRLDDFVRDLGRLGVQDVEVKADLGIPNAPAPPKDPANPDGPKRAKHTVDKAGE